MSFNDGLDLNDTFYQALPDETAAKTVEDTEKTVYFQKQLGTPTQAATKDTNKYITIDNKMKRHERT